MFGDKQGETEDEARLPAHAALLRRSKGGEVGPCLWRVIQSIRDRHTGIPDTQGVDKPPPKNDEKYQHANQGAALN